MRLTGLLNITNSLLFFSLHSRGWVDVEALDLSCQRPFVPNKLRARSNVVFVAICILV